MRTLRGQYEAITGEPEVVIRKQQKFREIWKKAEVFTSFGERIKWTYAPSRWLFPPPVLEQPCMTAFDTEWIVFKTLDIRMLEQPCMTAFDTKWIVFKTLEIQMLHLLIVGL